MPKDIIKSCFSNELLWPAPKSSETPRATQEHAADPKRAKSTQDCGKEGDFLPSPQPPIMALFP